jgi:N-acylneuraminate cytidylyltransferase
VIKGKTVLAIVPARGGSKGVSRKNIRDLCGKPLIAWTIEEAKKSRYIDRLVLSSEDAEIISVAQKYGLEVPFIRPKELAQDDTPGIEPVLHMINTLSDKYDYIVLLQATSPLRRVEDIDGCIDLCIQQQAKSCIAVSEVIENPYWMFTRTPNGVLTPLIPQEKEYTRRQDLPKVYITNGAVYVAKSEWLLQHKGFESLQTVGYVMPQERSVDIDCELDFRVCEFMKKR